MKLNMTLGSLFLFLISLFIVSPVFAGGQLVSLDADTYGSTNSDGTYGRIMRVVSQAFPCEGTEITFKFVDPKDGDYVMTNSGNSTFVFTKDRQPYYQDGESVCGTTAKMGSKVSGVRNVTVAVKNGDSVWADPPIIKVDFDGQYHAESYYSGYSYSPSQDHPYYRLIQSQGTSTPTSAPTSQPIYLLTTPTYQPIPSVQPRAIAVPVNDNKSDKKVEELNKKVENLQNQLAVSQKKQSALEIKLNQVMTWIKSIFPFFK